LNTNENQNFPKSYPAFFPQMSKNKVFPTTIQKYKWVKFQGQIISHPKAELSSSYLNTEKAIECFAAQTTC